MRLQSLRKRKVASHVQTFRDVLDECGLMDLGFLGSRYTWFKKCARDVYVWERLDRGVATTDWLDKYPAAQLKKPWRFEQVWLEDDGCHDTVAVAWSEGRGDLLMGKVVKKVERCQEKFKKWSRCCFSNITWEIAEKRRSRWCK